MSASGTVTKWEHDVFADRVAAETYGILIVNNTDAADLDVVDFVDDIVANEISGGGYTRKTLANVTAVHNTGHKFHITADDPTWTALDQTGITFGAAYIYEDAASDATRRLCARLSLTGDTSEGNDYTIDIDDTDGWYAVD